MTFGPDFGLSTKVKVMPHRDDLVECEDCDEKQRRGDCIETVDGLFYADEANTYSCGECGDCISEDQYDEYDGHCDPCFEDNFTACDYCSDSTPNDDIIVPDRSMDSLCQSCYDNNYSCCEGCSGEHHNDDLHCRDFSVLCDSCYEESGTPEIDVPSRWIGSNDCKETGSLRKFGVELETSSGEGYAGWLDRDAFGATEDGSTRGMEFVSAPLYGDDGLVAIRAFCNRANSEYYEVDEDCGFHLHCDLSDTTADERKSIALAYHYTRELWHKFIDSDRRDTCYSQLNWGGRYSHWGRDECVNGSDHPHTHERYIWVNWRAFYKHSTIEIRAHHATLDGREVCNWVKAHIKFIEYVKDLSVGQITRVFGNEDNDRQFAELKHIWQDNDLAGFYGSKMRDAA